LGRPSVWLHLGPAIGGQAGQLGVHWWGPNGGNLAIGGLAAICSGVTLLLAFFRLGESLPPEERHAAASSLKLLDLSVVRDSPSRQALTRLMIIMLIATAGFAVLHAILTFFIIDTLGLRVADEAGTASRLAGYVFCWIGFLTAMVQGGLIGRLVKKHGETSLMLAGLFLMAVGLSIMPLSHELWTLYLVTTPLAIGSALNSSTLPALLTFHSPGRHRGEVLGLSHAMMASLAGLSGRCSAAGSTTCGSPRRSSSAPGCVCSPWWSAWVCHATVRAKWLRRKPMRW